MLPHVIQPAADRDLDRAIVWYEKRQRGLGVELFEEFEKAVESICRFPDSHELVLPPYRRARLDRFPYTVLYEVRRDAVYIYGVIHNSMHESRWLNRLP